MLGLGSSKIVGVFVPGMVGSCSLVGGFGYIGRRFYCGDGTFVSPGWVTIISAGIFYTEIGQ